MPFSSFVASSGLGSSLVDADGAARFALEDDDSAARTDYYRWSKLIRRMASLDERLREDTAIMMAAGTPFPIVRCVAASGARRLRTHNTMMLALAPELDPGIPIWPVRLRPGQCGYPPRDARPWPRHFSARSLPSSARSRGGSDQRSADPLRTRPALSGCRAASTRGAADLGLKAARHLVLTPVSKQLRSVEQRGAALHPRPAAVCRRTSRQPRTRSRTHCYRAGSAGRRRRRSRTRRAECASGGRTRRSHRQTARSGDPRTDL